MYPRIENDLAAKIAAGRITPEDADLVRTFLFEYAAAHASSQTRIESFYRSLISWADRMSLSTASMAGVYRAIAALNDTGFKANTKRLYMTVLRSFLLWRAEAGALPERKVRELKLPPPDRATRSAADLVTREEYDHLIAASRNPRNRALVSMLYEGGFRPVELRRLLWGAVEFDRYGAIVTTSEKTGKARRVRLLSSASYLAQWREQSPAGTGADDLVFVTLQHPPRPLGDVMIIQLIDRLTARAGLRKLTPYQFRHSCITHMLRDGVPESTVKLQHWGSLSSQMLATYAHLTGADVDDVLLERAGVRVRPASASDRIVPAQCPRCLRVSAPTYDHCPGCGCPLTEEARAGIAAGRSAVVDHADELMALLRRIKKGEIDLD